MLKVCLFVFALFGASSMTGWGQNPDSTLADFSLDSLLNIKISSASKYEQATTQAPASVTILTADDIRDYGFNDLLEALQVIRSLYLSNDRNYAYIGIRGFSRPTDYNNRVLLMIDGVPTNDNVWGAVSVAPDYFTLNMDQIERIEVIRGGASALYGTYPMVGVINVVMKDGKTLDGGHFSTQGGTYGRWMGSVSWGKRTSKGADFSIGGRAGLSAGPDLYYPEYDSTASGGNALGLNDSRFGGGFAKFSWKGFSAKAYFTARNSGVPTGSYATIFGDERNRVTDHQIFGELSYTRELSANTELFVRSYLSNVYYQQFLAYDTADGGLYDEMSNGLWSGTEARLRWDIFSGNRIIAGAEWQQHFMTRFFIEDEAGIHADSTYPFFAYSFFLQDEWQPLKWLSFTGGLRFDRNLGGKRAVTPRLSALITPSASTTFKLVYGRAFRAPNLSELELEDGNTYVGNPNLTPEFANNYEIIWEQKLNAHFFTAVSGFYYHMEDIIDRIDPDGPGEETFSNLGEYTGYGAEVEIIARFTEGRRYFTAITWTQSTDDANGGWATNSPRVIAKIGASIRLLRHFNLASDFTAESPRLTLQDTETPAYVLWNSNLIFKPAWNKSTGLAGALRHSSWSVRATNLLDYKNCTPGGFEHLQAAIQQNGRAFVFKMMWDF